MNRRQRATTLGVILVVSTAAIACGQANDTTKLTELQRVRSGALDIVLLSPRDGLRHGKDTFTIEFRSASDGSLTDVGAVRASATMPMPGMPMFGSIEVQRTDVPGRYAANAQFDMAGTWRMAVEWDGPSGKGASAFSGRVQ